MRVFLAVLTGYMTFVVSAVILFQVTLNDPHATPSPVFAVVSVVWGILSAALGGFMAVRIGQRVSMMPSILVACLIAAGALTSLAVQREGSKWSQLCALFLMAPAAIAGGLIKRRKLS